MESDSRLIKVSQLRYMQLNLNHALEHLVSSLQVGPTIDEYMIYMYMGFFFPFSVTYGHNKTGRRLVRN